MAVGLKFTTSPRRLPAQRLSSQATGSKVVPISLTQPIPLHQSTAQGSVKRLPNNRALPLWLRSLMGAQKSLSILTWGLATAVLSVYGQTVYSQQLWSQEYRKLETLQRDERQLTAASELLKNQIAQQAEGSRTGLVPANPANTLFLQPAPQRPAPVAAPAPVVANPASSAPIGY